MALSIEEREIAKRGVDEAFADGVRRLFGVLDLGTLQSKSDAEAIARTKVGIAALVKTRRDFNALIDEETIK